jgi:hypothetical protein
MPLIEAYWDENGVLQQRLVAFAEETIDPMYKAERARALAERQVEQTRMAEAQESLQHLDANQNGHVSVREIRAGLKQGASTATEVKTVERRRPRPRKTVMAMVEGAAAAEEAAQTEAEAPAPLPDTTCGECGFTAATPAGLQSHRRARHG